MTVLVLCLSSLLAESLLLYYAQNSAGKIYQSLFLNPMIMPSWCLLLQEFKIPSAHLPNNNLQATVWAWALQEYKCTHNWGCCNSVQVRPRTFRSPAGRMRAMCTSDGRWNPDPATLVCTCECKHKLCLKSMISQLWWQKALEPLLLSVSCGAPSIARGVAVEPFNSTTVGSEIFYHVLSARASTWREQDISVGGRWEVEPWPSHLAVPDTWSR